MEDATCATEVGDATTGQRRGKRRRLTSNINVEANTIDCIVHGEGARLRTRKVGPNKDRVRYSCRQCDWVRKNPRRRRRGETPPEKRRLERIKSKYGLSAEEYQIMVQAQGGKCLICQTEAELVVDHDHATGAVRGLLCYRCNVALGWMNDSPTNLTRAAKYLRRRTA